MAAQMETDQGMIKQPSVNPYSRDLEVGKFWIICLNRKSRLKKFEQVASGPSISASANLRDAFRRAIQHEATAIPCVQDSPMSDPTPSSADLQISRQS